jgi:transposase InsO family protein
MHKDIPHLISRGNRVSEEMSFCLCPSRSLLSVGLLPQTRRHRGILRTSASGSFSQLSTGRGSVGVSPLPNAGTVMESLPLWVEHYNSFHPHKVIGYRSAQLNGRRLLKQHGMEDPMDGLECDLATRQKCRRRR